MSNFLIFPQLSLLSHSIKRVITLPMIVVSITLLTACGGGGSGSNSNSNNSSTSPPTNPANPTNPAEPNPPSQPDQPRTWTLAGGNATVPYDGNRPFLTLIPNLDINQSTGVSQGRELFITNWLPAGEGRPLFDGVGALFNATSCTSCHASTGRIAPYQADGTTTEAVLFRLGDKEGNVHPIWGAQLQPNVIANAVGLLAEGSVKANATTDVQGRAFYNFAFTSADSTQSLGNINLGARIAPHLVGMGLLDLVTDEQILAHTDPDDSNKDGISGRVHWVFEEGQKRIGKFGWKAINSSLKTQNATAMHQDMGLTSSVFLESNCTPNQPLCSQMPLGGSPEVSEQSLTAVVDFMTALSVPSRRISDQTSFDKGANLFDTLGCSQCHTPTLKTGVNARFNELSNQTIYAYTDLLLHDMGEGLDDGVKEKDAQSNEWRTPPLWGIGIVANSPDSRFLHDGRAKTLEEAIAWHGGEAQPASTRFGKLNEQEKIDFMAFLKGI